MHELSIATAMLEKVREVARQYPGVSAAKLGVRIGEVAGVDPEALRFCFSVLLRDTELEALTLDIQQCPCVYRCLECGEAFSLHDFRPLCPACRTADVQCVSGDELEFVYLEVDDYAPSTAATENPAGE